MTDPVQPFNLPNAGTLNVVQDVQSYLQQLNNSLNGQSNNLALAINANINDISTLQGEVAAFRIKLTAAQSYFVRSDGNDANTGTVNSAGGAWLTIQKAVNYVAANLDMGGQTVTVNVGAGTFAGWQWKSNVGQALVSSLTITGAGATTIINSGIQTAGPSIQGLMSNMQIATGAANVGINVVLGATLQIGAGITFGANIYHVAISSGGVVNLIGNFSITSGATFAFYVSTGGRLLAEAFGTCTLTGTPAWSGAFIYAENGANVRIPSNTFTGAATGLRYSVNSNSTMFTNGAGATYLPGSVNGTTSTGGVVT